MLPFPTGASLALPLGPFHRTNETEGMLIRNGQYLCSTQGRTAKRQSKRRDNTARAISTGIYRRPTKAVFLPHRLRMPAGPAGENDERSFITTHQLYSKPWKPPPLVHCLGLLYVA